MRKRVLIVGCGYVGLPLGRELVKQGHDVSGLRRTALADAPLRAAGIHPLHGDITKRESLRGLPRNFDWVVNCAATGGGTAEEYRHLYVTGNANLVEWLQGSALGKFVYTSSTSVYGQDDGAMVTESDPVAPAAEPAQRLAEAETILFNAWEKLKFPVVILRLAGIYGPGRGYWLKQFLRGEAQLDGDGSRVLNMIHLEDIVAAVVKALEVAAPGSVYNVVDNEPVSQRDLFAWLAQRLNRPAPATAPVAANRTRKRGVTNKRVSNQRLKQELGFACKFPTFRHGFAAELHRLARAGELPSNSAGT